MSNLKRPYKYREGQRKALEWFFSVPQNNPAILDVGCGIGTGIKHLIKMGYESVSGIDIDSERVALCKRRGLDVVCGNATFYEFKRKYNIIWMSHSLEHFIYPYMTIKNLLSSAEIPVRFYIVVPYPDFEPAEEHHASRFMGLNRNDKGNSFLEWLEFCGLEPYKHIFDDYRESEMWVKCIAKG